jgi:MFS family permease
MSNSPSTALVRPQGAHVSIGLVTLALFTGTAARVALSPIQELVKTDLHMTDNQIALLQGFAVALPLALVSIPIGSLVDRSHRKTLLTGLALLCAAGSALSAFAMDFATMFTARMLVGIAIAGAIPAAISMASDLSSTGVRGRAMSTLALGQVLGSAATYAVVGVLLSALPELFSERLGITSLAPWRLVQLVFALVMTLLGFMLLALHEPARQESGRAQGGDMRAALRELWDYRRLLIPLVIGVTTIGMADAAASIWAVPVLTRSFHLEPVDFGSWMGLVMLISGLGGVVAGGLLADYGQRLAGRGGILLGAAVAAGLSIPAAFFPVMGGVFGFATLFAVLLGAGACAGIVSTSAVAVLLPNELRGLCSSVLSAVGTVVAFGLAPSLVSVAAQLTGHGDDIRWPLAAVGAATSAIGLLAFLYSMRVARTRDPMTSHGAGLDETHC